MKHTIIAMIALAAWTLAAPAMAAETSESCNADFNACEKGCWDSHPEELLLRAKCITICSGSYAACDARVAYEAAKEGASKAYDKTKEGAAKAYEKTKDAAKDAKDYIHKKTE